MKTRYRLNMYYAYNSQFPGEDHIYKDYKKQETAEAYLCKELINIMQNHPGQYDVKKIMADGRIITNELVMSWMISVRHEEKED